MGFMILPNYRAWVVVASIAVCLAAWYVIEKTKLGAYLRAGTENPKMVEAFGINVPLMVTLTYGFGVALAAFAGVLAAPVIQVSPLMGQHLIIVVFAVVVIGGMGSIMGSIITGLGLGVIEGLTKVFYRGLVDGSVLHHGHRAAAAAGRPVREKSDWRTSAGDWRGGRGGRGGSGKRGAWRAEEDLVWIAAGGTDRRAARRCLSGVRAQGAVLRLVRLCLQPADRLHGAAVVRPRRLLRGRPTRPAMP